MLFWCLLSLEKGEALGLELIKDVRQGQTARTGSRLEASSMPIDDRECARACCTANNAITSSLSDDVESFLVSDLVRKQWARLSA